MDNVPIISMAAAVGPVLANVDVVTDNNRMARSKGHGGGVHVGPGAGEFVVQTILSFVISPTNGSHRQEAK